MEHDKFYVTTPIYYVNDVPHIGHAYTTIAADILARYNRVKGRDVFFLTGTDEHGQKVEKAAKERGKTPQEHADLMVGNFRALWEKLNISNDAFIRTTDNEHKDIVRLVLQELKDKREIVKRSYSGWYCTPDERFWTEREVVEGMCPDCKRPVEHIQEENYFFLMSKYQDRLIKHIEDNPSYIMPETRKNEVLGFLKHNELGDLCISRPKSRLSWGVPLPFDEDFVTYVWFDALLNYYSGTQYLAPGASPHVGANGRSPLRNWWPADHHLVGKDILTTHAVYWSTMLMALEWDLPRNIFAHGWWTVEGQKMSKSLGNVVDPGATAEKYGVDAFRYFLFREVTFGLDGDFSEEGLISRINGDLANDLGNLLSRFLTMAEKFLDGLINEPPDGATELNPFARECTYALHPVLDDVHSDDWTNLRFNIILDNIWTVIRAANNHIAREEPWKLAKEDAERLKLVMFNVWNALRLTAFSLYPFMPDTSLKIWKQLGLKALLDEARETTEIQAWEWSPGYEVKVAKGEQLFPRVDVKKKKLEKEKKMQRPVGAHGDAPVSKETSSDNLISINDFAKVQLKIGSVLEAERVEGSNKLLKLLVDTGEKRQIVAGIAKSYNPEELNGKKVVVVTNLKPAKLMGVESQGMLLAATDSEGVLSILTTEKDVKEGAIIK